MQRKSSYIDIIFAHIRDNLTAKSILKLLLEQFLRPYQASSQLFSNEYPNRALIDEMISCLKKSTDTDHIAVSAAIKRLINAHRIGIQLDENLLALFSAFFSVFQHYIFLLTTFSQMKSAEPLLTRIRIIRNLWINRFPHDLNHYRDNIYSLAYLRNSVCSDLNLLKDCIKVEVRQEIVASVLEYLTNENFHARKRACNTLGLLNEFIPDSQGPQVVKAVMQKLLDPKINVPERIEVEIEASRTVGLLRRFIPIDAFSLLFAFASKRMHCQNPDLKIAVMEMLAHLIQHSPDAIPGARKQLLSFVPFLIEQLHSDTAEIATAACALICNMRHIIPEQFHAEITENIFLLLKKPDLAKIACQTLGLLYPIIPLALRHIALLKLYGMIFDSEPYEHAARSFVIYKKYLNTPGFHQDVQEMLEVLDSEDSDDEAFIISVLANLSSCLSTTHLLQLVNHIMLKLINGGFFDKCNACRALGNIGELLPVFFIQPIILELKKIARNVMTSKYAIMTLINLKKIIPIDEFPEIMKFLLIQWQRQFDQSTQFVILNALKTFGENIPEGLQKTLMKRLCSLLSTSNTDIQDAIGNTIIGLFPKLTPDMQIFLLAQVADKKNDLYTKVFIYCNHIRSQNITLRQFETQLFSYTGIEDVAHLIRQQM